MNYTRRFVSAFTQRLGLVLLLCCSAMATTAWADPPGRVGRLGDLNGQVWLYSPDSGEWVTAERNRPLTSGDRLATDNGARAEVRVGSTALRLDSGTELEIVAIDDDHVSLQLHGGSLAARVRDAEQARQFELRTAEGRFTVYRPGRYRFDRDDATSYVTVWSGEAVYEGPGSALTVYNGQRAELWMENNAAQYTLTEPVRDEFADWSADRDRRDERTAASRYVSPEMTGVEDLDRYGQWQQMPDYGTVWVPSAVPADWAPYRTGHWVWVSPWGWTWVDEMPWGFAPFHYGRWAYVGTRWCWVPGSYVRRPVYAPALVGWVGGPQVNVSISIGSRQAPAVGWFPLAPREVYVPTYRVSPGYVQSVNVTHVTHITNITTIVNNPQGAVAQYDYANRRHHHGVTVVPQEVMVNRQPVSRQLAPASVVQQLLGQPASKVALPAAPVAPPPAVDARRQHHGNEGRPAGVPGQPVQSAQATQPAPPPPPITRFMPPHVRQGQAPAQAGTPAAVAAPQPAVQPQQPRPPVVSTPPRHTQAPVVAAPAQQAPAQQVTPPPQQARTAPPGEWRQREARPYQNRERIAPPQQQAVPPVAAQQAAQQAQQAQQARQAQQAQQAQQRRHEGRGQGQPPQARGREEQQHQAQTEQRREKAN